MFTCNIERRGRHLRIAVGTVLESAGLLLGVLWFLDQTPDWTIWPAVALWVSGTFVILEGMLGWCAIRAMGMKTPI